MGFLGSSYPSGTVTAPSQRAHLQFDSKSKARVEARNPEIPTVESRLREALIALHKRRSADNESALDAAASDFCVALRDDGQSPERVLIAAKRIIASAIDGDDAALAERAVRSCIKHYYNDVS